MNYNQLEVTDGVPVKMWTKGVPVETVAQSSWKTPPRLPDCFKHLAVMPDVHFGKGSTIGSVIPTKGDYSSRGGCGYWLRNDGV